MFGDLQPSKTVLTWETKPIRGQLLHQQLILNKGALDITTFVAGLVREEAVVKVSGMTTPFSTGSLILAVLSTNKTTTPFTHDADLTLMCPRASPTAKTASSTKQCTAGLNLTA